MLAERTRVEKPDSARTAPAPSVVRRRVRANTATAAGERFRAAALARDMDAIAALCADEIQVHHHPTGALINRDAGLKRFRMLCRAEGLAFAWEPLATLGDFLELGHDVTSFEHLEQDDLSFGASRSSYLNLMEVNAHGRIARHAMFDPDDTDAAYAEIDARYEAGEAAVFAHGRDSGRGLLDPFHARDWGAVAASLAPGFVLVDHRPLGWGRLDDRTYVESLKALVELSPDARLRCDHAWRCERGVLGVFLLSGTRDGGAFEEPRVVVAEHDSRGRQTRQDHYTLDQLERARARFEELGAGSAAPSDGQQFGATTTRRPGNDR